MPKNGLVDMHLHSNFSDGLESPREIAEYLSSAKVRLAALTDHDTMLGVPEFLYWASRNGVAAVSGVEVTSLYHGYEVHLLGFKVNYSNKDAESLFRTNKDWQAFQVKETCDYLRQRGYLNASLEEMTSWWNYPGYCISLLHVIEFIALKSGREHSEVKKAVFCHKVECEKLKPMSSQDAIRIINEELGGISVLAHPGEVECQVREIGKDNPQEVLDNLVSDLKMVGLRGIEAFHSRHVASDEVKYLGIAIGNNLGITAGSDYHGPRERFPEIGKAGARSDSVLAFLS